MATPEQRFTIPDLYRIHLQEFPNETTFSFPAELALPNTPLENLAGKNLWQEKDPRVVEKAVLALYGFPLDWRALHTIQFKINGDPGCIDVDCLYEEMLKLLYERFDWGVRLHRPTSVGVQTYPMGYAGSPKELEQIAIYKQDKFIGWTDTTGNECIPSDGDTVWLFPTPHPLKKSGSEFNLSRRIKLSGGFRLELTDIDPSTGICELTYEQAYDSLGPRLLENNASMPRTLVKVYARVTPDGFVIEETPTVKSIMSQTIDLLAKQGSYTQIATYNAIQFVKRNSLPLKQLFSDMLSIRADSASIEGWWLFASDNRELIMAPFGFDGADNFIKSSEGQIDSPLTMSNLLHRLHLLKFINIDSQSPTAAVQLLHEMALLRTLQLKSDPFIDHFPEISECLDHHYHKGYGHLNDARTPLNTYPLLLANILSKIVPDSLWQKTSPKSDIMQIQGKNNRRLITIPHPDFPLAFILEGDQITHPLFALAYPRDLANLLRNEVVPNFPLPPNSIRVLETKGFFNLFKFPFGD